jgi:hypothetical protein
LPSREVTASMSIASASPPSGLQPKLAVAEAAPESESSAAAASRRRFMVSSSGKSARL